MSTTERVELPSHEEIERLVRLARQERTRAIRALLGIGSAADRHEDPPHAVSLTSTHPSLRLA